MGYSNNNIKNTEKKHVHFEYEPAVEDEEKALTLYHLGWITRTQLAVVLKIPTNYLNSWLMNRIRKEIKNLKEQLNDVSVKPIPNNQSVLEHYDDSSSSESEDEQEEMALKLYHQRKMTRAALATRLKVPIESLDDYVLLKIQKIIKKSNSDIRILHSRSELGDKNVKNRKPNIMKNSKISSCSSVFQPVHTLKSGMINNNQFSYKNQNLEPSGLMAFSSISPKKMEKIVKVQKLS